MMLTDLAIAARKSELTVIERPGWLTRTNRASGMSGVKTIVCHHTAGPKTGNAPSLNYIETKKLSQLVLCRDGTVYVVAAGLCYHAGVVTKTEYGNSWSIGIEAEATGVDPWPKVQYDAYARLVRALMDHYRVPLGNVLGHKEVASPRGRKSDPNFDMGAFRQVVSGIKISPNYDREGEEDMPLNEADKKWLRENLVTRNDMDWVRDQIMLNLGFDPEPAGPTVGGKHNMGLQPARKGEVETQIQNAVNQILAALKSVGTQQPPTTKA